MKTNLRKRKLYGIVGVVALTTVLLAGCGRGGGGGAPAPQAQASEAAAVTVAVQTIRTGNLSETAAVTGELQAYNDTTVATKLGGKIIEVRVLEGTARAQGRCHRRARPDRPEVADSAGGGGGARGGVEPAPSGDRCPHAA
jgi:multidrug efflux pump subunit AcrA (membrane-fusion protein)